MTEVVVSDYGFTLNTSAYCANGAALRANRDLYLVRREPLVRRSCSQLLKSWLRRCFWLRKTLAM